MRYAVGAVSEKGNYKNKNQDRVIIKKGEIKNIPYVLACICDGIGSFENSEISSQMVVEGISLWNDSVKTGRIPFFDFYDIITDLKDTIQEINELVFEKKNEEMMKLGCTMSLLFVYGSLYEIIHVGDSRIYLVSELISKITEDEIRVSPKDGKSRLVNCVGKDSFLSFKTYSGKLNTGEGFVLGSDGLFKRMDFSLLKDGVFKVKSDEEAEALCRTLIRYVYEEGERDNVSALVVRSL